MSFRVYADLGNMTLHWGIFRDGQWLAFSRISSSEALSDRCAASLNCMLKETGESLDSYSGGLLCSSSPRLTGEFLEGLKERLSIVLPEVSPEILAGVPTLYHNREQIGPDRLVNAAAVRAHYECPAIVADLGSCITVDLVDADGVLVGGAIAPGLPTMKAGLIAQTPHLQSALDEIAPPTDLASRGRSTVECISLGLYTSLIATTRDLCQNLAADLDQVRILLTGGDAAWVRSATGFGDVLDEILTLKGLQSLDPDD